MVEYGQQRKGWEEIMMTNRVNDYCERFLQCRELVKEAFYWSASYYTIPICAAILSGSERELTVEDLKMYRNMIKGQTGVFSNFRGLVQEPMACMLAVSDDPEALLRNSLAAYDELKKHFTSSEYLTLVAMIIARLADSSEFTDIAEKTRMLYKRMRKAHPLLTSYEDGPFAAMMYFSGKSEDEIIEESEKCYEMLSGVVYKNVLQSVSHVLTLGEGEVSTKCDKFDRLHSALKQRGYSFGKDLHNVTLCALSIMPADVDTIADDITAAADMLKGNKGYGVFGASKRERLMHAAMIVNNCYVAADNGNAALGDTTLNCSLTATLAIIAAQQAATMAAITAATAANSASN